MKTMTTTMPGNEVCRYLSDSGRIFSIRDNGTRWYKTYTGRKWVHGWTRRADVPLEEWIARKRARYLARPAWQQGVRNFPSLKTLNFWAFDGVAETPSGDRVEPDGHGPDGAPSWILILGLL